MTFVLILIVLFFGLWLLMPWLKRRAQRMMLNKMEDMMRNAAGMPPREKKRDKSRKNSRKSSENSRSYNRGSSGSGHIIPPEYAEDVEFTEYKDYSSDVTAVSDGEGNVEYVEQEQVSDAVYVEIKDDERNDKKQR